MNVLDCIQDILPSHALAVRLRAFTVFWRAWKAKEHFQSDAITQIYLSGQQNTNASRISSIRWPILVTESEELPQRRSLPLSFSDCVRFLKVVMNDGKYKNICDAVKNDTLQEKTPLLFCLQQIRFNSDCFRRGSMLH